MPMAWSLWAKLGEHSRQLVHCEVAQEPCDLGSHGLHRATEEKLSHMHMVTRMIGKLIPRNP